MCVLRGSLSHLCSSSLGRVWHANARILSQSKEHRAASQRFWEALQDVLGESLGALSLDYTNSICRVGKRSDKEQACNSKPQTLSRNPKALILKPPILFVAGCRLPALEAVVAPSRKQSGTRMWGFLKIRGSFLGSYAKGCSIGSVCNSCIFFLKLVLSSRGYALMPVPGAVK